MRLWLDGQCLQTQRRRITCGFRTIDLLKRLIQADESIDLHVSLNAQWLDEAVAARRYLAEHLPMANVQIWQSVVEKITGAVSRETPGHRLSRLALTHHINCLAPDLALFPNPFEENSNIMSLTDSKSEISLNNLQCKLWYEILPELSKLFCTSIGIFYTTSSFISCKRCENIQLRYDSSTFRSLNKLNVAIIEAEKERDRFKDLLALISRKSQIVKVFDFEFDDFPLSKIIEYMKDGSHCKFNDKQDRKFNQKSINLSRSSLINHVSYGYNNKIVSKVMALSEPLKPKKSRLLFDATVTLLYNHHLNTGIQRVVRRLSDQLNSSDKLTEEVVTYDQSISMFKDEKQNPIIPSSKDIMIIIDPNWSIINSIESELKRFTLCNSKLVNGVHDLIPLHSPGIAVPGSAEEFVPWFKSMLLHASSIVCVSRAVADEVYTILGGIGFPYPVKIGFWQLGADMLDASKSERTNYTLKQSNDLMFIAVGTLEVRKGHRVVLEAFEELWNENWNVELTFVGMKGWLNDHFIDKLGRHPELDRRLHWYERLDDHALVEIYANADALILASYAEGFGLPIAEAGYFGKPVIVSDLPVFREVSAAAPQAFFFAPGSAEDLAAQIRNFSRESRNGLTAKSRPVAWPNWAESMEQLRSIVLKDQYYKIYQPKVKQNPFQTDYIGEIYTQSYLSAASQKYHLRLFDEPHKSRCRRFFNIILFVKNLSDKIYASNQDFNYKLGVRLGARPATGDNQAMGYAPTFTDIPFVLLPGHQHIMRISCPCPWWQHGAIAVEVDLLQVLPDGCNWWGKSPLRVALPPQGG